MDELTSVIQDVENLHDVLIKLKEKQDSQTNNAETDFERLYHYARSAPITGHKLAEQDEFIRRSYLRMLAGLVSQVKDSQRREKKIIHIGRILAAMPDGDLESLFADAATITIKDLDSFRENLPNDMRHLFLLDLLLLCWLDGKAEDAELQYCAGFINVFAVPAEQSDALVKAVQAALEQDRDALLGVAENLDFLPFLCYFDQSKCIVVSTLEEARQVKGKSVIVFGAEIADMDLPIDMDMFPAASVEFHKCVFRNMQGLFSEKTPVKIANCRFEDCKVRQNLLALYNSEIYGTDFVNCQATSAHHKNFYLIACHSSKIDRCIFKHCTIDEDEAINIEQTNHIMELVFAGEHVPVSCGGLVGTCASTITNCVFLSCSLRVIGTGQSYLICLEDGEISQCKFRKCSTVKSRIFTWLESSDFEKHGAVIKINCVKALAKENEFDEGITMEKYGDDPKRVCDINRIIKKQRKRIEAV